MDHISLTDVEGVMVLAVDRPPANAFDLDLWIRRECDRRDRPIQNLKSHPGCGGFQRRSRVFIDEHDGPLPALLLALTMLAGVVDATSILRLGHVFVATMTGNLVFIGLAAAAQRDLPWAPRPWRWRGLSLAY